VTPPAATAPASSSTAASAPSGVPAAAPAVAATEGYVVQLAAFADDKGANALAGRLKKSGYGAYVEPVQTSRGTLWRVRIGGYPSRDAADAARDKLKTEGQNGIVVPPR
jgi:DedD protein